MNYHGLFKNDAAQQIRVALVGVGDFGATLLDQSRNIDKIEINVICDKDEIRMQNAISNSGIKPPPMMVTDITADGLPAFDVLVEATGQPGAAAAVADLAIGNGCSGPRLTCSFDHHIESRQPISCNICHHHRRRLDAAVDDGIFHARFVFIADDIDLDLIDIP